MLDQVQHTLEILFVGLPDDRCILRQLIVCGPVRIFDTSAPEEIPDPNGPLEYVGVCRLPPDRKTAVFVHALRESGIPFLGIGDDESDLVEISLKLNSSAQIVERTVKLLREVCKHRRNLVEIANRPVALGVEDFVALIDQTINLRLPGSRERAERVAWFAVNIGKLFGMTMRELQLIRMASRTREIGKLTLPDRLIFNDDASISNADRASKRAFPALGSMIIQHVPQLTDLASIVACQLENMDGTGPSELKETQIPLAARILRVSAAYEHSEAALGIRCYADSMSVIWQGAGSIYDPEVLSALDTVVCQRDHGENLNPVRKSIVELTIGDWLGQSLFNRYGVSMFPYGHRVDAHTRSIIIELLMEMKLSLISTLTHQPSVNSHLVEEHDDDDVEMVISLPSRAN